MTVPPFDPQPCTDSNGNTVPCPEPQAFHRTTTSTGPVDHPGRQYDITLPINPGFAVQSLQVDQVTSAANIVWDVADPDGIQFAADLTSFIDGRIPASATVTITNPNVGQMICGTAAPMQIHIECIRLDQNPPNLIELVYNGGQDMVINPAYNETPPLNPPVAEGNYGFHLLGRQDNNVYPGNQPSNRANCTNVANRGWETNDVGNTFEIWGHDQTSGQNVTPTPRGTPVQEITSDGPPPGGRSTIWQTFQAPASGNFIIRVVHGARDAGENHRITLDNGDTNDAQNGDLIDNVTTNVGVVTSSPGGPGPWTQFNQTIPLTAGQTYTLSLSTNNPAGGARGGLFTDMRAYIDRPDLRATATTNDDTCVVTVDETTTNCTNELWSPTCTAGAITSWVNAETGQTLTNAAFWGQAPAPVPGSCPAAASDGSGGSVAANLTYTYTVCSIVGGVPTNLQRVVVTDASGGTLADSFIGPDGGPVATPSSYTIGSCTDTAFVNDVVLCDLIDGVGTISFLRKYVQTLDATGRGQVASFRDFDFTGGTYAVQGIVQDCTDVAADRETVCWTQTSTGGQVHTGTIRHVDGINAQGWLLFDQNRTLVPNSEPGLTFVPCSPDPFSTTGLCLADGTPIAVATRWDHATGAYVDDGWINLRTGAFSAGNPPAGAVACGSSSSVQVSGTFCDVSQPGNIVNALVLIEYHYDPDGTIASVRLVDATTGTTYTPVGTITTCPTGTPEPDGDVELLCDVNGGVATPFIRDYRRDQSGTITSISNYTLTGAAYTPTGTVGRCTDRDTEVVPLCDNNGTFLRRFSFDSTGAVSATADMTTTGAPYAPVGTITYGCTDPTATAQVYAMCTDVPHTEFATSGNLLRNGDFEQSSGVAGSSLAGPGWTTQYTACGPDLFNSPCGAQTWSFFTTTAAQVMSGGANGVPAQGSRSFAVNVGPNVNIPIIEWQTVYLVNGRTYKLEADAAVVFAPFDVAVKIGGPTAPGGLFPLSTPPTGNWGKTNATFTYSGTTGYTRVGLYSNNPAPGGNDHVFDNFTLKSIVTTSAGATTPRIYSGTNRTVIDQVVQTTNCNDDRRDALLGEVLDAVQPKFPATVDAIVQRQTGAGTITIAANARSVTLVVLAGNATVNLGQGVQMVPAGVTLTWAVDGPGELLSDTFAFTGIAGSDFVVTSTRQ